MFLLIEWGSDCPICLPGKVYLAVRKASSFKSTNKTRRKQEPRLLPKLNFENSQEYHKNIKKYEKTPKNHWKNMKEKIKLWKVTYGSKKMATRKFRIRAHIESNRAIRTHQLRPFAQQFLLGQLLVTGDPQVIIFIWLHNKRRVERERPVATVQWYFGFQV